MTAIPAVATPAPITLASALAAIKTLMMDQPEPARTDLINSLKWLEPAIEYEVDTAISAAAKRIPLAGSFIGGIVTDSFNKALEAGLVELTTA